MRPLSRVVPKEMFPVGLRPMIEYSVAEAVLSGMVEVAIVVSPRKEGLVREYFDVASPPGCGLEFVIQPEPLGLMDAVRRAAGFTRGEPFAVLLPDNLFMGEPALGQLLGVWSEHRTSVIGLTRASAAEVAALGPRSPLKLSPLDGSGRTFRVTEFGAEKRPLRPGPGSESTINVGRYVFEPEVLAVIEAVADRLESDELDDVPVAANLARQGRLLGRLIDGAYHDLGNPLGYWRANAAVQPERGGQPADVVDGPPTADSISSTSN